MHTYKLEAGRAIIRDDVPFCNIAKTQRDGPYISPSDLDAFARLCAVAPALLEVLTALRGAVSEYEDDDTLDRVKAMADALLAGLDLGRI